MGLGLGSAGFPIAGIQLVVLGAGAAVTSVTKFTGAINTMNGSQEAAARASAMASRAYKEQAKVLGTVAAGSKEAAAATAAMARIVDTATGRVQARAKALALSIAATTATIVGAGLIAITRQLRDLADEFERTEIAAVRVAKIQGVTQREFKETREAIVQQAFTLVQAQTAMTKLNAAQVELSNSVRLAAVANDIAISKNIDAAKTYDRLTQSVSRASTETLESLGIAAKTTDVFRRFQLEIGATNRELTMSEKRTAVLNEIYRQGARFAGAFADAQGTVAVQTRRQTTEIDSLTRRIGAGLTPVFVSIARLVRSSVRVIAGFNDETLRTAAIVAGVGASVLVLVGSLASLVRVVQLLAPALKFIFLASPWGILISLLAAAAVAVGLYIAKTQEATDVTEELNKVAGPDLQRALTASKNAVIEFQIAMVDMQMKAIAAQREALEASVDMLDEQRFKIRQALQGIEDEFFRLEIATLELDKPLFPLIDALFLVEAQAARVLIPLKRRERALERGLKLLRQQKNEEEERLKALLRRLKDQIDDQAELVRLRREELQLTQHEAFMEDLRNRIRKQATSGQLLELQSQARLQEDILARAQAELKSMRDRAKEERERLRIIQEAAENMLEASEAQLRAIQMVIELEEERVRVHKEDLELARASQAQQRLLIAQQTRILKERERFTRRDLEMASRAITLLERQLTVLDKLEKKLEETRQDLELQIIIDTSPLHEVESILDEIKRRMTDEMAESGKSVKLTWEFIFAAIQDGWERLWSFIQNSFDTTGQEMWDRFPEWAMATWNKIRRWWLVTAVPWIQQKLIDMKDWFLSLFPDWFRTGAEAFGMWYAGFTARAEGVAFVIRSMLGLDLLDRTLQNVPNFPSLNVLSPAQATGALGSQAVSSPMIINNYNTIQGPRVDLTANYADVQSESSIRRDLSDVFEFYR